MIGSRPVTISTTCLHTGDTSSFPRGGAGVAFPRLHSVECECPERVFHVFIICTLLLRRGDTKSNCRCFRE